MPNQQLARGLWAQFATQENPFGVANGMEQNLRHIDDHLALYTLLPPQAPGTPLPGNPFDGDGQAYTDGSYATFNGGTWCTYAPRRGIRVVLASGTESWLNTGTGWEQFSVVDTGPAVQAAVAAATGVAEAEITPLMQEAQAARDEAVPAASAAQAARVAAEMARDAALIQSGVYIDEPTGRAAVADGAYFKVIGTGDIACTEYRRTNASTSVLVTTYPSKSFIDSGKGTAGTAMTAEGAGYASINPDAPGYGITTVQTSSVTITKGKVGYPVTVTKAANTGSSTWFGIHLRIPYTSLSDLNKVFNFNALTVAGVAPSTANIVPETTDWNPANSPVGLDVSKLLDGGSGVNLYQTIMASAYASVYQTRAYLHVILAYFNPSSGAIDAATATWTVRPRFESSLDVIANKATIALKSSLLSGVEAELDQLSGFVVVPKKILTDVYATKSSGSSTATIDAQYTRTDAGVSVVMGYDVTMNNVSGYTYSHAKFFSNYATEAASKKFRFFIKSNNKTTTVALRLTNGGAWGSPDGSLGFVTADRSVVLNAANNYQATIDIDYADPAIAAFYAQSVRAKAGYFILAYDGTTTSEAIKLSTYCSEITGVSVPSADMTYGYVASAADYAAQISELQSDLDATTAEIATPKTPLTNINATKLNASSTALIGTTYTRIDGGQTVNTGYDVTLHNVSGYAYSWAKLFDTYATQASTKKYRVLVKSNNKDATIQVRFTNAAAWGSGDGSIGQVTDQTVVQLNAANNYQATVDIDYSAADIAAFYAQTVRLKAGYVILSLDNIITSEPVVFSTYCYELASTSASAADMTRGYVSTIVGLSELEQQVASLSADLKPSYITCWGDSLTAGGGWTTTLQTLSGLTVYNGGTGGENSQTIMARQGGDVMVVNNITIPATTTPVQLAKRDVDGGIKTMLGVTVTPLLQGGAHVNPCKIAGVVGTLSWTGSSYADMTGTWTFTRSAAGAEVQITRPTAIRTDFDMNRNGGIQIIFIGQNGGYSSNDDLIRQHRLMIEHSTAKHTIILGLSSGSAASRADYEAAMKLAFGRYFISLREYLATPIYTSGGVITSCYGLADAGITPTSTDLTAIASGTVPPSLLADAVHYNDACKTVIGKLIYARMRDLNLV